MVLVSAHGLHARESFGLPAEISGLLKHLEWVELYLNEASLPLISKPANNRTQIR